MQSAAPTPAFHNIADPANVRSGMLKALVCLRDSALIDGELWTGCYVFACTCIDGLAHAPSGQVGTMIVAYIRSHFPTLEAQVGGQVFYDNFRCKAVHEFGMQAPYAIGRGAVTDPYLLPDTSGASRIILNVDKFVQDVIDHLQPPPPQSGYFGPPVSTITPTVTGKP